MADKPGANGADGLTVASLIGCGQGLLVVSGEAVREIADLIPGANYREIPGDVFGLMPALDAATLADVIEEFVTGTTPAPVTNRVLATVLFTDLVGSTERAAQMGDRAVPRYVEPFETTRRW